MAHDFRSSRFRRHDDIAEDINPSAYIVNLADCMLVLAVGFMVALVSHWNIDISSVTKMDATDMQQVDPQTLPEDITQQGGSYYVEAGKVYRDPNTGELYMVEGVDEGTSASADTATSTTSTGTSTSSSGTGSISSATGGSSSSGAVSQGTQDARANGAD